MHRAHPSFPTCPICVEPLGTYGGPATLSCGHNACLDCLSTVQAAARARQPPGGASAAAAASSAAAAARCPLCRAPLPQRLGVNRELQEALAAVMHYPPVPPPLGAGGATKTTAAAAAAAAGSGGAAAAAPVDEWETLPTAQATAAQYAEETKARRAAQQAAHAAVLEAALRAGAGAGASSSSAAGADADPKAASARPAEPSAPPAPAAAAAYNSSSSSKRKKKGGKKAGGTSGESGSSPDPTTHGGGTGGCNSGNNGTPTPTPTTAAPTIDRGLLSLEAPAWLPDSYASSCRGCSQPFAPLFRLRHHCRCCGFLFCASCSNQKMLLPPKYGEREPRRVCELCKTLLEPLQPYLLGAATHAAQPPVHDAHDAVALRSWLNPPYGGNMQAELYKAANIARQWRDAGVGEQQQTGGGTAAATNGATAALLQAAAAPSAAAARAAAAADAAALKAARWAGLPDSALEGAKGLVLLSAVRVGAVGWGACAGTGVVVARLPDEQGPGRWSAPCAVALAGAGLGPQLGGALVDVVLVLRTDAALRAFCSGVSLGAAAGCAVALGPIGRDASVSVARVGAAADSARAPAAPGDVVGYSVARGCFAGLSLLEGTVVRVRDDVNERFYGRKVAAKELLMPHETEAEEAGRVAMPLVAQPPAAAALYEELEALVERFGGGAMAAAAAAAPQAAAAAAPRRLSAAEREQRALEDAGARAAAEAPTRLDAAAARRRVVAAGARLASGAAALAGGAASAARRAASSSFKAKAPPSAAPAPLATAAAPTALASSDAGSSSNYADAADPDLEQLPSAPTAPVAVAVAATAPPLPATTTQRRAGKVGGGGNGRWFAGRRPPVSSEDDEEEEEDEEEMGARFAQMLF